MLKGVLTALFAALLASASSGVAAQAGPEQFAGTWAGKGVYLMNGDVTSCSLIEIIFAVSGTTFTNVGGKRICETHEQTFGEDRMDARDGNLLFGGQIIGGYEGNTMHAALREPTQHRNWRMSMRREGNALLYEESFTNDGDPNPITSFAALLKIRRD